ncbi:hypothetical protein [uncultured Cetobacterium sp.]|uniref:hypothetical protein n=1 Tax=uncultured Cetobacterium sp. TaxID=527638 RepID=UPI002613BBE4|nr:hypothetical protein [uncultured Cetobacterium sp.]
MRLGKSKFLLLFCLINTLIYAEKADELKELLDFGIITQEDYDILSGNFGTQDGEYLYELRINGVVKSKIYEVIVKDKKLYFPLFKFFQSIDFKNYSNSKNNHIEFFLGDSLKKVELTENYFIMDGEKIEFQEKSLFKNNEEIFLSEDIFKEIFMKELKIDRRNFRIAMFLNFSTPKDIELRVSTMKEELEEKKDQNELIFTNEKSIFELGYLKTKLSQNFTKNKSEKDGFDTEWDGSLEYQGSTLYGQLTTEYNLKESELEDVFLRYNELWKKHTLEVGSYSLGDDNKRELGLSFKKDKGYIISSDKVYIIKENVPLGSRVELIYLGIPIEIKDSENGIIEFNNAEIRGNREYLLKIYNLDGSVTLKKINTTDDFNQQNKGQIEYNVDLRENDESKKITLNSDLYYGLTDNLTMGLGYDREIEKVNEKYEYLENGKLNLTYGDFLFSYPYVLSGDFSKTLNNLSYDDGKNTKDRYEYDLVGQIDIDKIRLKIEQEKKGKYYSEKESNNYEIEYRPFTGLDLIYTYNEKKYYSGDYKNISKINATYSKSIKNILFSTEYERSTDLNDIYSLNIYYSGFRSFTTRLENRWENNGKDFETALTIFSSSSKALDYTVEARYSEKDKEMITFRFNLKYNNWFNFDMFADKKGNQEYSVGIDRVIDLKNPREEIKSMDSSRVKVITFIDLNNNNIYDESEPKINNVKVKIGEKEKVTNEKGEAFFYGVPNQVKYNLNPIIRKPSFVLGNNKIIIKGSNTSTLTAYIPIKPLLTLSGIINIDDSLKKSKSEKMAMYGEILIKIKDLNGKILDMSIPDETGVFEMSGLLPKKYILEASYLGNTYVISELNKEIQLSFLNSELNSKFAFNVSAESFY